MVTMLYILAVVVPEARVIARTAAQVAERGYLKDTMVALSGLALPEAQEEPEMPAVQLPAALEVLAVAVGSIIHTPVKADKMAQMDLMGTIMLRHITLEEPAAVETCTSSRNQAGGQISRMGQAAAEDVITIG